ncbi:hypothetical protein H0485_01655 [Pseudogemmobacter sp. CC-YST710]|uniref:Oxidoreductase molybdopterin-binding domain-containing protein n=1 Tax=Pseudogemmobacter faecipullorum TaxID=2755041 RepID=A0ABS8CH56_9RHOB|nr:hypothetical protein [Pseudogemmobacter faecipullorum]
MLKITYSTGKSLALSDADLAALPWHNLRTHTFWTDGVQEFRGPSLRDVMALGTEAETLRGKTFRMKALNEFSVEVPADDMFDSNPLLAREMNGRPMQVRDKGPLWLVYPRDDRPDLQNPVYDDRWIWQLNDIKVL